MRVMVRNDNYPGHNKDLIERLNQQYGYARDVKEYFDLKQIYERNFVKQLLLEATFFGVDYLIKPPKNHRHTKPMAFNNLFFLPQDKIAARDLLCQTDCDGDGKGGQETSSQEAEAEVCISD